MKERGARAHARWSGAALAAALLAAGLAAPPPAAGANVSVIPYRADGWRYQVYYSAPPVGWQLPGFDDSGFARGCAAFGTQGECYIVPCTEWPLGTRIVLRKSFDLPPGTDRVTIGVAFDNQVEVYVNGVPVGAAGGPLEECSNYNRTVFNAPASVLQAAGNVIAVLGTDYGVHDLLDVNVEALPSGPPPPPPPPADCQASDDDVLGVTVTWSDEEGEIGYEVSRDGTRIHTAGPDETSYFDTPDPGTYVYCVRTIYPDGLSEFCCDAGRRPVPPAPAYCQASDDDSRGVTFTWSDAEGEIGYLVSRDGVLIHTAGPDETSYFDTPDEGSHYYCVQARYSYGVSDRCCEIGRRLPPPRPPMPEPCQASDGSTEGVTVTWTEVPEVDGYGVSRDGALVHTAAAGTSSYFDVPPVGRYSYCIEAFAASEVSWPCCDFGARLWLLPPATCDASDDYPTRVIVTWSDVEGAEGYRIFRDADLVHTTGPDETSYSDVPETGTYLYCVQAVGADGQSELCCDSGTRTSAPPPGWCRASDEDPSGVLFEWDDVSGEEGYRVYRDGELVHSAGPDETSVSDTPAPGTYTYCVQPVYAVGTAAPCCDAGTRPGSGLACAASDTGTVGVLVTWSAVPGAEGYRVLRDGALVHTSGPEEASYYDTPVAGTYLYCVEAFDASGVLAECCDNGSRSDGVPPGPGRVRLSWGTCDPQVAETQFHGPDVYQVVVSATGVGEPLLGHDTNLLIGPEVADCWRFDDIGCQGPGAWVATPTAFSKTCPALRGANALTIVHYGYDAGRGRAALRLAVTYDDLTPAPGTRYTLWQVEFDHTRSVVGPGEPGTSCGGAELGVYFDCEYALILATSGQAVGLEPTPGDARLSWGGAPVRAEKTTWGRLKGMYR